MTKRLLVIAAGALLLAACGDSTDTATDDPIIVVDGAVASGELAPPGDDAAEDDTAGDSTTEGAKPQSDAINVESVDTEASAEPTASEALPAGATDEDRALAFADCLRDEGLDVNDPTVDATGSVDMTTLSDGNVAQLLSENEAAFDSCQPLLEGGNFGPGGGEFDQTEIQDQLVEFAGCLREEGLDVRDPDISGGLAAAAGGPEALFGLDLQDPQYEAEVNACSGLLAFAAGGQGA